MPNYADLGRLEDEMAALKRREALAMALRQRRSPQTGMAGQIGGGIARGLARRDLRGIQGQMGPVRNEQRDIRQQALDELRAEILRQQGGGVPAAARMMQ